MYAKQSPKSKMQKLTSQYHQDQALKSIEARRKKYRKQIHKRRLILLGVIFGVAILFFSIQILETKHSNQNLQAQTKTSQVQLKKVKANNTALKQQVRQLNDQTYLEKIIRERYYYSKSGEIIFSLPGDKPSN